MLNVSPSAADAASALEVSTLRDDNPVIASRADNIISKLLVYSVTFLIKAHALPSDSDREGIEDAHCFESNQQAQKIQSFTRLLTWLNHEGIFDSIYIKMQVARPKNDNETVRYLLRSFSMSSLLEGEGDDISLLIALLAVIDLSLFNALVTEHKLKPVEASRQLSNIIRYIPSSQPVSKESVEKKRKQWQEALARNEANEAKALFREIVSIFSRLNATDQLEIATILIQTWVNPALKVTDLEPRGVACESAIEILTHCSPSICIQLWNLLPAESIQKQLQDDENPRVQQLACQVVRTTMRHLPSDCLLSVWQSVEVDVLNCLKKENRFLSVGAHDAVFTMIERLPTTQLADVWPKIEEPFMQALTVAESFSTVAMELRRQEICRVIIRIMECSPTEVFRIWSEVLEKGHLLQWLAGQWFAIPRPLPLARELLSLIKCAFGRLPIDKLPAAWETVQGAIEGESERFSGIRTEVREILVIVAKRLPPAGLMSVWEIIHKEVISRVFVLSFSKFEITVGLECPLIGSAIQIMFQRMTLEQVLNIWSVIKKQLLENGLVSKRPETLSACWKLAKTALQCLPPAESNIFWEEIKGLVTHKLKRTDSDTFDVQCDLDIVDYQDQLDFDYIFDSRPLYYLMAVSLEYCPEIWPFIEEKLMSRLVFRSYIHKNSLGVLVSAAQHVSAVQVTAIWKKIIGSNFLSWSWWENYYYGYSKSDDNLFKLLVLMLEGCSLAAISSLWKNKLQSIVVRSFQNHCHVVVKTKALAVMILIMEYLPTTDKCDWFDLNVLSEHEFTQSLVDCLHFTDNSCPTSISQSVNPREVGARFLAELPNDYLVKKIKERWVRIVSEALRDYGSDGELTNMRKGMIALAQHPTVFLQLRADEQCAFLDLAQAIIYDQHAWMERLPERIRHIAWNWLLRREGPQSVFSARSTTLAAVCHQWQKQIMVLSCLPKTKTQVNVQVTRLIFSYLNGDNVHSVEPASVVNHTPRLGFR